MIYFSTNFLVESLKLAGFENIKTFRYSNEILADLKFEGNQKMKTSIKTFESETEIGEANIISLVAIPYKNWEYSQEFDPDEREFYILLRELFTRKYWKVADEDIFVSQELPEKTLKTLIQSVNKFFKELENEHARMIEFDLK